MEHVYNIREFEKYRTDVIGHSQAPDEELAPYCGEQHLVLITVDNDFKGKWVRNGLLAKNGVEVIVMRQSMMAGAPEQLRVISNCLPYWSVLELEPYGHRVWEHRGRGNRQYIPIQRRR